VRKTEPNNKQNLIISIMGKSWVSTNFNDVEYPAHKLNSSLKRRGSETPGTVADSAKFPCPDMN
jgi:hypothetical protein